MYCAMEPAWQVLILSLIVSLVFGAVRARMGSRDEESAFVRTERVSYIKQDEDLVRSTASSCRDEAENDHDGDRHDASFHLSSRAHAVQQSHTFSRVRENETSREGS